MAFITMKKTSEDDVAELARLNSEVIKAIDSRTKWLDEKMEEYSNFHVGDSLYNIDNGCFLGNVSRLYRYWTKQNKLLDNTLTVEYEYETSPRRFDNTSRQSSARIGSKEDAVEWANLKFKLLKRG
jgi:hypothetical protein